MRKVVVVVAAIAALGFSTSPAFSARYIVVSVEVLKSICGGHVDRTCQWCNLLYCYWVGSCSSTKCVVTVAREKKLSPREALTLPPMTTAPPRR
jgi:hypothetical protein